MGIEEKPSSIQTIRLWRVQNGALQEIGKTKLDLEEKLEEWISSDISAINPNLLVIGRQVPTNFGGAIDLLAMEENGDIVIIELKRDKTPREITAQVLDYASWVKDLTAEQIQNIAEKHLEKIGFEQAYQKKFSHDLPDSINEQHKMLVIGSEIDSSSRRIISYLSENYGVDINAITFNYFRNSDCEFIARTFLIEPATQIVKQGTRLQKTEEQLQAIANEKGIGDVYSYLTKELSHLFDSKGTTRSSLAFSGLQAGKMNTIFSIIPQESSSEEGLKFRVYCKRFSEFFKITEDVTESILPGNKKEWKYYKSAPAELSGYEGFFKGSGQVEDFLRKLKNAKLTTHGK